MDIGGGKIIYPEQVLQAPPPAGGAIILNIPSNEYLESLTANSILQNYYRKNIKT